MILIQCQNPDDVLYLRPSLTVTKKDLLFGKFPVTYGRIFSQDVAVVTGVYESYSSEAVTFHFGQSSFLLLNLVLGTCQEVKGDLPVGGLVLSRRVYLSDVDLSRVADVHAGQIPNFPVYYETPEEMRKFFLDGFSGEVQTPLAEGVFFSQTKPGSGPLDESVLPVLTPSEIEIGTAIVTDLNTGGAFFASEVLGVPAFALKVVDSRSPKDMLPEDYSRVLTSYSSVGRAVLRAIGEIGRNDFLQGV
jgi:hypothetical protein